jgi:hypothetical protein
MIKLKDLLNEEASKIFTQSLIAKISNNIRKITKCPDVEYTEHRFASGEGGFKFVWTTGRGQKSGMFDMSLRKDGKHTYTCKAYYGGMGYATKSPMYGYEGKTNPKLSKGISTWRDLTDDNLLAMYKEKEKHIKKNDKDVEKWWAKEAKSMSDFYAKGGKQD